MNDARLLQIESDLAEIKALLKSFISGGGGETLRSDMRLRQDAKDILGKIKARNSKKKIDGNGGGKRTTAP